MILLDIRDLGKHFGGLLALEDFCLEVPEGALYGLIGPNGAGKTTVFNLISGFLTPSRGRISLNGRDLTSRPPHQITALGVGRTFQNIRLFKELSVLDHVLVGLHCHSRASWAEAVLRLPRYRGEEREGQQRALQLLTEVGLAEAAAQPAGQLPYGHQRRLEIARALATGPRLLLLDEPAAGLNPQETQESDGFSAADQGALPPDPAGHRTQPAAGDESLPTPDGAGLRPHHRHRCAGGGAPPSGSDPGLSGEVKKFSYWVGAAREPPWRFAANFTAENLAGHGFPAQDKKGRPSGSPLRG